MRNRMLVAAIFVLLVGGYFIFTTKSAKAPESEKSVSPVHPETPSAEPVTVSPVSHASMVLTWGDLTIYNDPIGEPSAYASYKPADLILVSDIHGDHFSPTTLQALLRPETVLIAPQAVIDSMPDDLKPRATMLANGITIEQLGLTITGVPMYNMPEDIRSKHVKGRGNGYLLSKDGYTVYIAGDTGGTPEMRALKNVDMAFVPMNDPTMTVNEAADAVLEFAPRVVYAYHYRNQGGYSDVSQFKGLVDEGKKPIEVRLLEWYPQPK